LSDPHAGAGRVLARFGRRYIVALDQPGTLPAEADAVPRGRRLEVVTGDRVDCSRERELLVIESIQPRRNLLYRSDASHTKPLAANVDQLAIVFAPQPPPQKEFVWRALLAARSADIAPLAVLNKTDLADAATRALLDEVAAWDVPVLRLSARTEPQAARAALAQRCEGRVTLFVGQSGMGKSTLLNLLVDAEVRTGALSRRGSHGRQTTTATRWFDFGPQGALIDSPGFHEFGLAHLAPDQLIRWMPEFAAVQAPCRFADCRHFEEPGCAVRAAVEDGRIARERYAFYRKLWEEEAAQRKVSRGF
jgi:ribosome biogenesis GTPase